MSKRDAFVDATESSESRVEKFKPTFGETIEVAIAPGIGTSKWYEGMALHWGFNIPSEGNPKGRSRPFLCYFNKNQGIEDACDEMARKYEAKMKSRELEVKDAGGRVSDDAKYTALKAMYNRYSKNLKFYMNCFTETGKVGQLILPTTTFRLLKTKVDEMLARGQKPISKDGCVVFQICRPNKNGREDTVEVKRKEVVVDGETLERIHRIEMTDEIIDGILALPKIQDLPKFYQVSMEKIQELVDGGPNISQEEVLRILGPLGGAQKQKAKPKHEVEVDESDEDWEEEVEAPKPKAKAKAKPVVEEEEEDWEEEVEAPKPKAKPKAKKVVDLDELEESPKAKSKKPVAEEEDEDSEPDLDDLFD